MSSVSKSLSSSCNIHQTTPPKDVTLYRSHWKSKEQLTPWHMELWGIRPQPATTQSIQSGEGALETLLLCILLSSLQIPAANSQKKQRNNPRYTRKGIVTSWLCIASMFTRNLLQKLIRWRLQSTGDLLRMLVVMATLKLNIKSPTKLMAM